MRICVKVIYLFICIVPPLCIGTWHRQWDKTGCYFKEFIIWDLWIEILCLDCYIAPPVWNEHSEHFSVGCEPYPVGLCGAYVFFLFFKVMWWELGCAHRSRIKALECWLSVHKLLLCQSPQKNWSLHRFILLFKFALTTVWVSHAAYGKTAASFKILFF